MNSNRPLYPEHGMAYDLAMMEAEKEYQAWLKQRKESGRTINVYSRKAKESE